MPLPKGVLPDVMGGTDKGRRSQILSSGYVNHTAVLTAAVAFRLPAIPAHYFADAPYR